MVSPRLYSFGDLIFTKKLIFLKFSKFNFAKHIVNRENYFCENLCPRKFLPLRDCRQNNFVPVSGFWLLSLDPLPPPFLAAKILKNSFVFWEKLPSFSILAALPRLPPSLSSRKLLTGTNIFCRQSLSYTTDFNVLENILFDKEK